MLRFFSLNCVKLIISTGPDYLDDFYYTDYADIRGRGGDKAIRRPSDYFLDPSKGKKTQLTAVKPLEYQNK